MRRAVLPLLAALSLPACAPVEQGRDRAAMTVQAHVRSEALADRFQQELLGVLTAAIAADGPQGAVGICASIAPTLAARLSEESGARVRRTALKARNPMAAPDATERQVMTDWTANPLDESGRPRRRVSREGGGYRYMRAIPTMPMCLACHGETIAPEVKAAIQAHYPADQATGFAPGALRGAFSVRWDEAALARAIRKDGEARR